MPEFIDPKPGDVTKEEIIIRWKPSDDENGIKSYIINVFDPDSGEKLYTSGAISEDELIKDGENYFCNLSEVIDGIEINENTNFDVEISAIDEASNKSEADKINIVTLPAISTIDPSKSGWDNTDKYYIDLAIKNVGEGIEYKYIRKKETNNDFTIDYESNWFGMEEVNQEVAKGETFVVRDSNNITAHGTYKYQIVTRNNIGGTSKSNFCNPYTVENQLPKYNNDDLNLSPEDGIYINKDDVNSNQGKIIFQISEFTDTNTNDVLSYRLYISEYDKDNGVWSDFIPKDIDPILSDGIVKFTAKLSTETKYRWYIEAIDNHQGKGRTPEYSFTLDKHVTAPAFIITNPDDVEEREIRNTNNKEISLKISNISNEINRIDILENDKKIDEIYIDENQQVYTKNITMTDTEQEKAITLKVYDQAGNTAVIDKMINYDITSPDKPANVKCTAGPKFDQIKINWDSVNDIGQSASGIKGYLISYTGHDQEILLSSSTSYIADDFDYNQQVTFNIKSIDKAGNLSQVETIDCYSLAEPGEITNHSLDEHQITLNIKEVDAYQYRIIKEKVDGEGQITSSTKSQWLMMNTENLTYTDSELEAHGKYNLKIQTRNRDGNQNKPEGYELSPYQVIVPNQEPTQPGIDAERYQYSNDLLLTTTGSTDSDSDQLTYYFTIKDENGQILKDKSPASNEEGLSYQVPDDIKDSLNSGDIIKWQVFVSDGHMFDQEGNKQYIASDEVTTIYDNQEPEVNITTNPAGLDLTKYHSSLELNAAVSDKDSKVKEIYYYWNQEDILPENRDKTIIDVNSLTGNQFVIDNILEGKNNLHIVVEDAAGNKNKTDLTCKLDTSAPVIENIEISGQEVDNRLYTTKSTSITAEWQIVEDNTDIQYYRVAAVTAEEQNNLDKISEEKYIKIDGPFSKDKEYYQYTINGEFDENEDYCFVVEAVNKVGEKSISVSSSVTIDSKAPIIEKIELKNLKIVGEDRYLTDINSLSAVVDNNDGDGVGIKDVVYALTNDLSYEADHNWYSSIDELKSSKDIVDGTTYYLLVKAEDKLSQTNTANSKGFIIDQSKPVIEKLIAGSKLDINSSDVYRTRPGSDIPLSFIIDEQTPISSISYSIGDSAGDTSITEKLYPESNGWLALENLNKTQQLKMNESLDDGSYYINLKVENAAGLISKASTNQIIIDSQMEARPEIINDGGVYSSDNSKIAIKWSFDNAPMSIKSYEYQIVNSSKEIVKDWTNVPAEVWNDVQNKGNSWVYEINNLNLNTGENYYIKIRAQYSNSSYSGVGSSDGITIDTTSPTNLVIDDKAYTSSDKLYLEWSAEDKESGIKDIKIKIGSEMYGNDILDEYVLDQSGKMTLTDVTLPDNPNEVYYVTLSVTNGADLTAEESSNGFQVDNTPPEKPLVNDRMDYIKQPPLNFNWSQSCIDPQSGLKKYKIALLTSREVSGDTEWTDIGKEIEKNFTDNLEEGQWYYLAVKAVNKAGLESEVGYSNGILIDSTKPDMLIINEQDRYLETGDNLEVTVSARDQQSGIGNYEYCIGTYQNPEQIQKWKVVELENGSINIDIDNKYEHGENYFVRVKAFNKVEDDVMYYQGTSNGFMAIKGYPEIENIKDSGDFTPFNDKLAVSWQCNNTGYAPINYYKLEISTDGTNWTSAKNTKDKFAVVKPEDIGLEEFKDGKTYYISVIGINKAGKATLDSEKGITDGIKVDNSPPDTDKIRIKHPHRYTTNKYKIHLIAKDNDNTKAEPHSGIAEYQYALGSVPGAADVTDGWITVNSSGTVYEKWQKFDFKHNQRYYLSFKIKNKTNLWSEIVTDDGIKADITPPVVSKVESISDYITNSKQIVFDWAADDEESGISEYKYKVVKNSVSVDDIDWKDISTILTEETSGRITKKLDDSYITEGNKYKVVFTAKNILGVWSEPISSQILTVDTISPEIEINNNIVTNGEEKKINWQISEKGTVKFELFNEANTVINEKIVDVNDASREYNYIFNETNVGLYRLDINVEDPAGNSSTKSIDIRVNAAPEVTINGKLNGSMTIYKARDLKLSATVNDPDGSNKDIQYLWDFGNGVTSTDKAPIANFNQVKEFTVTLTCTDKDGGVGTDTVQVLVTNTLSGELASDEQWSGSMVLKDTVIVPEDISLTIVPGTTIKVPTDKTIKIIGSLIVNGSNKEKVLITTNNENQLWQGLTILPGQDDIQLKNTIIENAVRGIVLNNRYAVIESNIIRNNQAGIHLLNASPDITDCQILNNVLFGIKEDGECEPILTNNYFENNEAGDYYDSELTVLSPKELEVINND